MFTPLPSNFPTERVVILKWVTPRTVLFSNIFQQVVGLDTLVQAIEQVHEGHEYIEPSLKEQMMQNMFQFRKQGKKSPTLTRREVEILHHIIEENTNQEIADKLFLSLRTVEKHRFSLLQKPEVKNTAGLVKTLIEMGLVK